MTNIPLFKIGDLKIEGLVQGAMGVGISEINLPVAFAEEGGAATIASVGLGALHNYPGNYIEANCNALRDTIKSVRKRTKGVVGVNIMHALTDYINLVKTAVDVSINGKTCIDFIVSGAGIPRDLPNYINGKNIKLIPIVSSARVVSGICKSWKRLGHIPDAIIVEGPKAGGHLGYNKEQLKDSNFVSSGLEKVLLEVNSVVKEYGDIPLIAAGGIFYGGDIRKLIESRELGVAGVQIATRLVPTKECDADEKFKWVYINAKKEDIVFINSPVGMPGSAIINTFLKDIFKGKKENFKCRYKCLKTCEPNKSDYCIANALIEARKGKFDKGFVFAGRNAYLCNKENCLDKNGNFISVKEVFKKLKKEYAERICSY